MLDRRSSGRFTHQRARVGPRLWSRIRKQLLTRSFVLATWSPCRGPRRSAASELAVVPSATPGSPSSNAWTARLRHARPRHIPRPNSLRALHRVPSSAGVCAYSQARQWAETGGSAFETKTGSESQIAISHLSRLTQYRVTTRPPASLLDTWLRGHHREPRAGRPPRSPCERAR